MHFINDFLTISEVIFELFHESSVAQFTFHTYVIIHTHLNGLHFGDTFFGVYFEEGAVGNYKWYLVNSLQIHLSPIFLNVIPVSIKIMGITFCFHVDFCNNREFATSRTGRDNIFK